MCTIFLGFLAALLTVTYAAVPPAGKCDINHIKPISVDPKSLLGTWDIIYLTDDGQTTDSIDHITSVITQNDDHTMKRVTTTVFSSKPENSSFHETSPTLQRYASANHDMFKKDKSSSSQEYTVAVVDVTILEDAIDNGKPTHYHLYPLASTSEGALLIYRCADFARLPVDVRFIAIPKGKTLSEESLKQLLDVDRKNNFKGELIKFPNQLC